jgi:nitrogen regulatory protein P-II 1
LIDENLIIYNLIVGFMKRVEAIISNDKLAAVIETLKKTGVGGITVFNARGWGRASRLAKIKRNADENDLDPKSYLLTVVDDSLVDKVISAILDNASTGSPGDGKIFVDTIETAVDIGSRQKGIHAI